MTAGGQSMLQQFVDEQVVVEVEDEINHFLTGHHGISYISPPQPRGQALQLVRMLLGYTCSELDGDDRWTCPIAGGRRTVKLKSATGALREEDYHHGDGDRSQEARREDWRCR